jgi:hypothetical protein
MARQQDSSFVGEVKQGVRDIVEGEPFFGVGTKLLKPAGERVITEYNHLTQKWGAPAEQRAKTSRLLREAKKGEVSRKGLAGTRRAR